MKPTFFATPAEFRAWFEANHQSAKELLVGFYKRGSGKPSISWPESVDEALCFGWIDGVRRGADDHHTIRFTPRKAKSKWSAINVNHVKRLTAAKRMKPAGVTAYEARGEKAGLNYSYETRRPFDPALKAQFESNKRAWAFFTAQPPGYQRIALWWVMNAKREETRLKRLKTLIADSTAGRRLGVASGKATGG